MRENKVSTWLYRHPKSRLAILLSAPMAWLVIAYLGSLATMFVSAFWTVDSFTGNLIRHFSLENFRILFSQSVYRTIALRSFGVAVFVTILDALIAIPIAFFMAKVLSPRLRSFAVVVIVLPLWASYLVKTYAWRTMFSNGGVLVWFFKPLHIPTPGYGLLATAITLAYLWLPYMILPIYAGLER
jgi:putative spermidine/putrescine transport system permease protein